MGTIRSKALKRLAILDLALLVVVVLWASSGCAVQRAKAPQIDAKTTYALNLESQVDQANSDYNTIFKDVGNAQRNGQLTQADVNNLNTIGHHLQGILQEADRLSKVYAQNFDASIAAQIGGLLSQIASDFAQLNTQKATAMAKKGAN
jgi:hypothetical protein